MDVLLIFFWLLLTRRVFPQLLPVSVLIDLAGKGVPSSVPTFGKWVRRFLPGYGSSETYAGTPHSGVFQ